MTACSTCGRGNHERVRYEIKVPIQYEEDENVHACQPMMDENRYRDLWKRPHIYIFKDFGENFWTLMTGRKEIGFEYTKVSHCPYCEEELKCSGN